MSQKWRGLKTMKQLNDWWMNSLGNGYVKLGFDMIFTKSSTKWRIPFIN